MFSINFLLPFQNPYPLTLAFFWQSFAMWQQKNEFLGIFLVLSVMLYKKMPKNEKNHQIVETYKFGGNLFYFIELYSLNRHP